MNDIMDEFEFKPLTEGLGFQNRASQNTTPSPQAKTTSSPQIPAATQNTGFSSLSTPLPRNSGTTSSTNFNSTASTDLQSGLPSTTVDDILKTLQSRKNPGLLNSKPTKIDATPEKTQYRAASFEISAGILDLMLVLAINLLCVIILLMTTKVDLFANLYNPGSDSLIFLSLGILFAGSSWIYLVTTRIFVGFTPGEWVFDQRLGLPEQTGQALYSLKVFLRSTLVLLTGFVVFPVLSLLFGRDLLGQITGLEVMRKV